MAGSTSTWTRLGSNTNSTINTDSAAEENVSVVQSATGASGINAQVRHECHMWLDDTNAIYTKTFDWAINTDFTVVMNGALQTLAGDPGNLECVIQGSIDNTNWVDMRDMGDWDAGTATVGQLTYDFDGYGRMPYMKINVDGNAVDNSAEPFTINVFMHNM